MKGTSKVYVPIVNKKDYDTAVTYMGPIERVLESEFDYKKLNQATEWSNRYRKLEKIDPAKIDVSSDELEATRQQARDIDSRLLDAVYKYGRRLEREADETSETEDLTEE